jgi:hypothetical protein
MTPMQEKNWSSPQLRLWCHVINYGRLVTYQGRMPMIGWEKCSPWSHLYHSLIQMSRVMPIRISGYQSWWIVKSNDIVNYINHTIFKSRLDLYKMKMWLSKPLSLTSFKRLPILTLAFLTHTALLTVVLENILQFRWGGLLGKVISKYIGKE